MIFLRSCPNIGIGGDVDVLIGSGVWHGAAPEPVAAIVGVAANRIVALRPARKRLPSAGGGSPILDVGWRRSIFCTWIEEQIGAPHDHRAQDKIAVGVGRER